MADAEVSRKHRFLEKGIWDVWSCDLVYAMMFMRDKARTHPYVAFDTEFPGTVIPDNSVPAPRGSSQTQVFSTEIFRVMKYSVNSTNVIQMGFSFFDINGVPASPVSSLQFNFYFDVERGRQNKKSIDLLTAAGVPWDRHKTEGIHPYLFSALIRQTGLLDNNGITWLCYQGAVDFAYLVNILHGQGFCCMRSFFPPVYFYFRNFLDVKYLVLNWKNPDGSRVIDAQVEGLRGLAVALGVESTGLRHQAAGDSLTTGEVFFQIKARFTSQMDVAGLGRYALKLASFGHIEATGYEHTELIELDDFFGKYQ